MRDSPYVETAASKALREAAHRLGSRHGLRTSLVGEIGLGKRTAIGQIVEPAVQVLDGILLRGEHDPLRSAYHPIAMALAGIIDAAERRSFLKELAIDAGADLLQLVPILGPFAHRVVSTYKSWRVPSKRVISDPRDIAMKMGAVLQRIVRRKPVVLVLTNVERYDFSSLTILLQLATAAPPGLSFILTYDPTYVESRTDIDRAKIAEVMFHLKHHLYFGELEFAPFDLEQVREYISRHRVSEHDERSAAALLHRKSGGNPLYLAELARHVEWTPEGLQVDTLATIPTSLARLLEHRLDRLSKRLRSVADVASVVGFEFAPPPVAAATKLEMLETLEALKELEHSHQLVRELSDRHRFSHETVRDHLYEELGPSLAQRHHRAIALFLKGQPESRRDSYVLFRHCVHGGLLEDAIEFIQRAAADSQRALSHDEAANRFSEAAELVALMPDVHPELHDRMLLAEGASRVRAGQFLVAIECLAPLARGTAPQDIRARALLELSRAQYMGQDNATGIGTLEFLLRSHGDSLSDQDLFEARASLSSMLYTAGDWKRARKQYRKAHRSPILLSDVEARVQLAKRMNMFYPPDLCVGRLERAREELDEKTSPHLHWELTHNIAVLGELDRAVLGFESCVAAFDRQGSYRVCYAYNDLGLCALARGDYDHASSLFRLARETSPSTFEALCARLNSLIVRVLHHGAPAGLDELLELDRQVDAQAEPILSEAIRCTAGWALHLADRQAEARQLIRLSVPMRGNPWLEMKVARRARLLVAAGGRLSSALEHALGLLERTGRRDAWSFREMDYEFADLWFWE